jgi:type IV secretory pathway VirB10-like protein
MKRCWRSWPRTTWKLSPRSSLWSTSVPKLPRAVHGTRHHKPELPRRVARMASPKTTKRRRRRTAATRGRRLMLRSSQLQLRAGTSATSAHDHKEATTARALCTPTVATAPRSVARSSSSRSASASGASRLPRMAPHLVAGLARRGSTTEKWPRENGTSGISPPSRSSRTSSLETPTPVMIPTAARSCT